MNLHHLSALQLDALKEISNIGMGHAATALSQLLGERIMLQVPRLRIAELAEIPGCLGGPEKIVAGVTLQILGDARGSILLVFPQQSAQDLLSRLLHSDKDDLLHTEMGASTLKEIGNILASAYLNALGRLLDLALIPSVPLLAYDMAGAVIDDMLIELSRRGDLALLVETEFRGEAREGAPICGHFLMLPDPASLSILLRIVKVR
jgi:chemotaxis protein CheC